jgi:hypothetical protein
MDPYYLDTPEYTIEVWDINGVYVMDISDLIATSLSITTKINDVEDISMSIDLVQFEKRCASVGANPRSILEPYRTDIKIRRNNRYICGGQVVQVNVNFNNQDTNKIEIKCTGYLNYFKDRFVSNMYRGMTYAEIARQLITDTQSVPNIITNSHFYEDISGWVASNAGYIAWDATNGNDYPGSLYVSATTGTNANAGARFAIDMVAGATYTATFWAKATVATGNLYITAEPSINHGTTAIASTNWIQYTTSWTQTVDSTYFDIKTDAGTTTNFYIDDVTLTSSLDDPTYFDFGVTLGVDTASAGQQDDRVRTYDIQNVKDGVVNLTSLESDNFDFIFDANKVFNIYSRLGSDKPDIELVYPQNITSIVVSRDASTLANRIIGLGSGLGSERLETVATGYTSAAAYRIRERTETFNSVVEQDTLDENTFGKLAIYQDIYEVPAITVEANHLDMNNVWTGDAVNVRVDGSSFVTSINGLYRIIGIRMTIDPDMNESVSLDMVVW